MTLRWKTALVGSASTETYEKEMLFYRYLQEFPNPLTESAMMGYWSSSLRHGGAVQILSLMKFRPDTPIIGFLPWGPLGRRQSMEWS